ncbi:MAG: carbohydrate kinase family protein, partial [bacterium]|nr:carbohydrate kinase family protein [bacterium]
MFDVITFGAGAMDIYVKSEKFLVKGKDIRVPIGSKTEVEDIMMFSGGGGTNAAATFAKQGFKTAYCGMVGEDCFGDLTIEGLKNLGINTGLVLETKKKPTNTSVFLASPGKDKTILVYRGASDLLSKNDIPWSEIKNTKWFYLAPFAGKMADLTDD